MFFKNIAYYKPGLATKMYLNYSSLILRVFIKASCCVTLSRFESPGY